MPINLPTFSLRRQCFGENRSTNRGGFAGDGESCNAGYAVQSAGLQYVNVGTNIDCSVAPAENGRYRVRVNLNDTSAIEPPARQSPAAAGSAPAAVNAPTLRNFSYTNSILLKDGEMKQFVAASDKVSGDVVRVDVTLTVEK